MSVWFMVCFKVPMIICFMVCFKVPMSICVMVCVKVPMSICVMVCVKVPMIICFMVCFKVPMSICVMVRMSICVLVCVKVPVSICFMVCVKVPMSVCFMVCVKVPMSICVMVCVKVPMSICVLVCVKVTVVICVMVCFKVTVVICVMVCFKVSMSSCFMVCVMVPMRVFFMVCFKGTNEYLFHGLCQAAILDDQSRCGRGERLALALARENINSLIEGPSEARVEVDVYELIKDSQYDTTETMCQILPKGVVSVIGPASSPASGSTISHICGEKEIPHVKIGPEETPKLPYLRFASVTLYPSNEDLSLAIGSILHSFGYPTASLVCAKAECLLRLEELVHRFLISRETLSVRMLDESLDPTPLLKEIRDDKVATIIIDANASISYHILRKANELGMTSAFYKYILTTMDFPLLRLDDVVDGQSNIIGFSMLNTSHSFYLEFIRSLNLSWREGCDISPYPGPAVRDTSTLTLKGGTWDG
ncbi:glutamate receptor ionotropic, kainate 5-like [Notolabrus celidotus]|uniref:glutamate receptor ionotropic, kainate 5-like n=1 Tax=Notolabrus celidotus TaxID=1203425 RepID=UPI00148F8999|nr:glutamate receptor ionotropic, kainate 5-like [Notolabrus celidotus]